MGNCNFQEATVTLETEHFTGNPSLTLTLSRGDTAAGDQGEFPISICDREGRLREGLESRAQEGQAVVCNEGDVQGTRTYEEKCQLRPQRAEGPPAAQS